MQEIDAVLTVNTVKNVPLFYPFCNVCLRKIQAHKNQRWHCAYCGNWQRESQVQHRFRMIFNVTDGHRLADVTVFGKSLDEMFGKTADQFNKYLVELESELFEKEVSVKQVLPHAVQQVFCGSTFCFSFSVPMNRSKSPTQVNLKWLETKLTGGLIAKRISFPTNDKKGHPTVNESFQIFTEKLRLKRETHLTDIENCLCESSYFFNSYSEMSPGETLCTKPLPSNTFSESVVFCSPDYCGIDVSLSESGLSWSQDSKRNDLDCNAYLPWMDGSILISSTPLQINVPTKIAVAKSPHSMQNDLKCCENNSNHFSSLKFGENYAAVVKFNEDGTRGQKKCSKELLPFYQTDDKVNQSCYINSDCIISSPSANSSLANEDACDKSVESSVMFHQMHSCDLLTSALDSALSPDIFK